MITNNKIVCHWQDNIYEGVFMPIIPFYNDTVITPRGKGIVRDRIIDCIEGKTIVELEIISLNEKS